MVFALIRQLRIFVLTVTAANWKIKRFSLRARSPLIDSLSHLIHVKSLFFYFTNKIKDFSFLRHIQTTEVTTTTTGLYLFFLLPIFLMEEKFLDCFLLLPLLPSCVTLFLCYMKSNVAVSTFYSSSLLQRFHLLIHPPGCRTKKDTKEKKGQ